jgi:hypothetical protein
MTNITETAFSRLEFDRRLLNPLLKAPTHKPGRFGFRGGLALKFAPQLADEARPPELAADQVMATAEQGSNTLSFFAAYLLSFGSLEQLAEVLGDSIGPDEKYFVFCNNIDLSSRYQVRLGQGSFYIYPLDESIVYNERLDLLYLEKGDLKRLDTAGKLDKIADKAAGFATAFEEISYETGLERMGPVSNPYENRPV